MNNIPAALSLTFLMAVYACSSPTGTDPVINKIDAAIVYAKEPNDSASYKHLKYDFYVGKDGQLYERKRVLARDTACHCEFELYYDSTFPIYNGDTPIHKPLQSIVDIDSFVWLDSTEYSKDKNNVYYFFGNSDGGTRVIVDKADPATFKRLGEYRWGIDKNHVFYQGEMLEGLNLQKLQVLYPPDTADHFIQYVKDDRLVFYGYQIVAGADARTFKVVSNQKWEAEDKHYQYETGRRN